MSGTVDNLMARGAPSPEAFAYDERPIACVSMLGMWLLVAVGCAWFFWKTWFSSDPL